VLKNQEYDRVFDRKIEQVEVITSVQRQRWSAEEKAAIAQET